jgi:hypothetical protein
VCDRYESVPSFVVPEKHTSGTGSDREVVEVPSKTRASYRRESERVDYKWGLPMPPENIPVVGNMTTVPIRNHNKFDWNAR